MQLYYIQGSPFARMARVLVREYGLPCEEILVPEFPPQPGYFEINPLGQVPALVDNGNALFPTRIVLEHLVAKAAANGLPNTRLSRTLFREGRYPEDNQLLTVLLALGDMMVAVQYQKWSGLVPSGPNHLNYNPVERNQHRVYRTLDWLESKALTGGFWPECASIQDAVLACLIFWSESRGPIAWRGRPKLESIAAGFETWRSYEETRPLPLNF